MDIRYKKINEKLLVDTKSVVVREQLSILEQDKSISLSDKKGNITIYIGDVHKVLSLLPDSIVDCVVTSPPYWKQRDYKNSKQIGQENSYCDYIKKLVHIFNEIKRILKPTGTVFLNIGYKYQDKELLLIPEMLAIELQRNGWTLLNKIIWHKPNAMPSSLDNRFSNV